MDGTEEGARASAAKRLRLLDEVPQGQLWMVGAQMLVAAVAALLIAPRVMVPHADFLAFWAAHHVADPYDAEQVAQLTGVWLPYSYLPTFLLLTLPFRWMSDFGAYLGWVALSSAVLVGAIRRPLGIAVMYAPAVFISGFIGQSSLITGALLFLGLATAKTPRLAGVCIGLAACVKPQAGVLIPLALIAAGQWRTILAAAVTVLAVAAASALVYGPGIWVDWIQSLPRFLKMNDAHLTAKYLALPGAWKFAALAVGAVCVWRAARRGDMLLAGLIAVAAALLGSVHALGYDQATLAPFALVAAIERRLFGLPLLAFLALPLSMPAVLFAGAYACLLSELRPVGPVSRHRSCGG